MAYVDLVIRNGHVIDPKNNVDSIADVAVKNSVIYDVGANLNVKAQSEFDARGCLVTPGLIDTHVHCYQYATPLGINPDECCLARGVTTVVDAGSAGSCTFPGLRKFIAERSRTRVLCFLHIASHGMAAAGCSGGALGGELDSLPQIDVESCKQCIQDNRDMIVGIKIRLSTSISDNGKHEEEAFRRALTAANACRVPLMVHFGVSSIPVQAEQDNTASLTCPGSLCAGDLLTHAYHGYPSSILDPNTKDLYPDVRSARSRGVLFDVGHGQGAFNWTVFELCAERSFWPDTISTDLHTGNNNGPAYDLPSVMGKFLHVGMPLYDVIRAVTSNAADAIGWSDKIGSLSVGNEADISVLRLENCDVDVEDCLAQVRRVRKRFVPVTVWRCGLQHKVTNPEPWPNMESVRRIAPQWNNAIIRDKMPPEHL